MESSLKELTTNFTIPLANPSHNPWGPSCCGMYGGLIYTTAYFLLLQWIWMHDFINKSVWNITVGNLCIPSWLHDTGQAVNQTADLSLMRPGFDPRPVYVVSVFHKVALEQVSLNALQFSSQLFQQCPLLISCIYPWHSLTHFTQQSPSWAANQITAGQEIPHIYGTQGFITALTRAHHTSLAWAYHRWHYITLNVLLNKTYPACHWPLHYALDLNPSSS